MLDEDGFGHHGPGAAGTGEPGDRRQQMQKKDGHIAHRTIVARSRHAQTCSRILEFATHSLPGICHAEHARVIVYEREALVIGQQHLL